MRVQELVSQASCVRYFDVSAPVVLQVDASDYASDYGTQVPFVKLNRTLRANWKRNCSYCKAFHQFDQLLSGKSEVVVLTSSSTSTSENTSSVTSHHLLTGLSQIAERNQQSNPAKHIFSHRWRFRPSSCNSPQYITFWPAQRLFVRSLRSNLPPPTNTVAPSTSHRDSVVTDHLHHKLYQKRGYDKYAGRLPRDFLYGRKVSAKPPPNSSSKAYILGKIINSASPRSYLIKTDSRQIRRSRAKEKLALLQLLSLLVVGLKTLLPMPKGFDLTVLTAVHGVFHR